MDCPPRREQEWDSTRDEEHFSLHVHFLFSVTRQDPAKSLEMCFSPYRDKTVTLINHCNDTLMSLV